MRTSPWLVAGLVALLVAVPALSALGSAAPTAPGAGAASEFVVGYSGPASLVAVSAAGGHVRSVDAKLGFAVVDLTPAQAAALAASGAGAGIAFVQANGLIHATSAQWTASQWSSSSWDASSWDASSWDAATWDSAQWDSAQWSAATWDASTWSASTWDASQWSASQWDASQWSSSQWSASQWDSSQWSSSQWSSSQWSSSQWSSSQWSSSQWSGNVTMDPGFPIQWNLGAMHVPDAWQITMGYHAHAVCTVDSGIDPSHPDLAPNVLRAANGSFGWNFIANNASPYDDGGHGTHMAGIIAAVTGNGQGIAGISQSYILAAKVLDRNGTGTEANLARGIQWCTDNGANIILLAVESNADPAIALAIQYAESKNVLIVAASGNEGARCDTCVDYPAAYPGVLSVGASMPDGSIASFSNGGHGLSLVAPGYKIPGTWPGDRYAIGSGTSQAAADAAGAAALVWAAHPSLTAAQVRDVLIESAQKPTPDSEANKLIYGAGYLRLDRALESLDPSS
ncbi:MAG: S8 family serine peptidase [Thermoplasmatota archaeon]